MQTELFLSGMLSMVLIVAVRYLIVSGGFAALTRAVHPELSAIPDAARRRRQIRREIGWSLSAAVIYAIPAGLVATWWRHFDGTRIYTDPMQYGLVWLVLSVPVYLFLHDTYFYWSHKLMHHPKLFRRVHAVHHESRPPTAWAAMSFHPWESLAGAAVIPLLALVIPIHWVALALVLTTMTIFGVTNHMGWEIFPRRWLDGAFGSVMITASHHHLHHRNYRCNYGLYFRFWDRVCGTDNGLAKELNHEDAPAHAHQPVAAGVSARIRG
jgi:sterol desaturase/sphingolipid hydroxylase (fatty acid hydroxylase superfamily)